ncbi:hypothetical protein IHQ68_03425 [Chelatococcus sambhunathii]|uniref:Uncharacterized protein n=1 Tax=Chelatococcus sambhunathii TaxID=363953 RepID=A0ABU1DC33_9HYPH|nr:hypothetical protein [Chelatococcus sambhunathii]MDR4305673.1 hypothetical protein [Chelatococcus sambhunathii]
MRVTASIALALSISSAPFDAAMSQGIMGAEGRCKSFKMAGHDLTRGCAGKMLNTTYPDGRVGFYFVMTDGSIVTFSGYDRPNPTPDTDLMAIDKIIVANKRSGKSDEFAAFGRCTYGNFYKGFRTVSCRATSQDGTEHSGIFELTSAPKP